MNNDPKQKGWRPDIAGIDDPTVGWLASQIGSLWLRAYHRFFPPPLQAWALHNLLKDTPTFGLEWIVGRRYRSQARWPDALKAIRKNSPPDLGRPHDFDTLLPSLFHHGPSNRALCLMDVDEALALWTLCRTGPAKSVVEIGRFKGGSTFLLACAMAEEGRLLSIDMKDRYDAQFSKVLKATGLADRVELVVADSRTYEPANPMAVDLLFLDGGHSTEQVLADIQAWYPRLKTGGLLCLHDAVNARKSAVVLPSVAAAVDQMFASPMYAWDRVIEVGSLLAVRKLGRPS